MRARTRMELANAEATEARAVAAADVERANAERRGQVAARRESGDDAADGADDEPLGVRTMPAARTVMAELQRPPPARRFAVSEFDVWVFRVLGSVAAACFILLLVALVRVLI
jgi:hypothetical protein